MGTPLEDFFVPKASTLNEWHEWKGSRYLISYGYDKEFVVPRNFEVKEIQVVPDGTIHVIMRERT
jgi:hypothetical protein